MGIPDTRRSKIRAFNRPEALRYHIKRFVAVVQNLQGDAFMVFTTGDDKYYLFDQLDPYGCSTCHQFPVLKADLLPIVRSALRNGVGNCNLGALTGRKRDA